MVSDCMISLLADHEITHSPSERCTRCIYEARIEDNHSEMGNSLAVRIPRPFAEEVHLEENSAVDMTSKGGKLIIVPAEPEITLSSLVEQITAENRHDELGTGPRAGNEVW
jgi:antitoxin MazE